MPSIVLSIAVAQRTPDAKQLDFEQSDEWLNLEIEVARLQKEVSERYGRYSSFVVVSLHCVPEKPTVL